MNMQQYTAIMFGTIKHFLFVQCIERKRATAYRDFLNCSISAKTYLRQTMVFAFLSVKVEIFNTYVIAKQ